MRKFGLFLCLSLLFAFTGCSDSDDVEEQGGTVLAKPSVTVTTTTSASFKVTWNAVSNAESYKYRLSQENETGDEITVLPEMTTSATALAFGDLSPRTKYVLRVKAVAAAGSGLNDSEEAKIFATTLDEKQAELTFDKIAVSNPSYQSVDVEIVPAADNLYYWQVVENSLVADKSDREIIAALKENITELTSGPVKKSVSGLTAETQYTVVAFGYDLDKGQKTSAVARLSEPFTTPADSRMTIAIAAGAVADNKVRVTFTPSAADADYFADLLPAKEVAGKSELEIVALLQAKYGSPMTDIARKGKFEGDFAVEEKTNYTAVAFGYSDADKELTTRLFTAEIKNGGTDADVSEAWADMKCIYGTLQDGSPALGAQVYPNEHTKSVKMLRYTLSVNATSPEQAGMTVEELREEILKEGQTLTDNLKGEDGSYQPAYKIEYGKVYLIANVALDAAGKGGEANWFIVKAQESAQGSPEMLGMSEKNDNNAGGGDVPPATSEAWADLSASWELQESQAGIFFDCTPNESTNAIKYGAWTLRVPATSLGQIGMTENDLRAMVLSDGRDLNMKNLYAGFKASAGQAWLFAIVASDAAGNYGGVNWIIAQVPEELSGEYGDCTTLGESENNNAGGGLELTSATYEDYLGNWTVVSAGSAVLSSDGLSITQDPLYYSIRIEENVKDESYKVYGWNTDSEFANAHPFVMNYDPTQTEGISGWLEIPLAQKLFTEDNIDWTLCPRFILGNSYYYYSDTDLSQAFIGVTEASGMVIIMGNEYNFGADGSAEMQAMSILGLDNTNEEARPVTRPAETTHAMGPFILVKNTAAAAAVKRVRTGRTMAGLAHLASVRNEFARFSTAATLSQNPAAVQRVVKQIPARQATGQPNGVLGDPSKPRMTVLYR